MKNYRVPNHIGSKVCSDGHLLLVFSFTFNSQYKAGAKNFVEIGDCFNRETGEISSRHTAELFYNHNSKPSLYFMHNGEKVDFDSIHFY